MKLVVSYINFAVKLSHSPPSHLLLNPQHLPGGHCQASSTLIPAQDFVEMNIYRQNSLKLPIINYYQK